MPNSSCSAMRIPRACSAVHTFAANPYTLSLASRTASASSLNAWMVTTGPKISSWLVAQFIGSPSITVGNQYAPPRTRSGNSLRSGARPPHNTRPPSARARSTAAATFPRCAADTSEPCSVSASIGSPTRSARTRSTNASRNRSYIPRSTNTRLPHRQI